MNYVTTHVDGKVAADGARIRRLWFSFSHHFARSENDALALPNHSDDRARREELAQPIEKLERLEIVVVTLRLLLSGDDELESDELEALLLEAAHYLADKTALHCIGFERNEGPLVLGAVHPSDRH